MIFEKLLRIPPFFRDEVCLDFNYVPENLIHREREIKELCSIFLPLLTNPNTISRSVIITGKTGIGKTVTVKHFEKLLTRAGIKRNVNIKTIHINCRLERTDYRILMKILRTLEKGFPKRGYSPQDLIDIISSLLNDDLKLLIILDDLNHLIRRDSDMLYSLLSLSISKPSIIGIINDISSLRNLDNTLTTLQRNIIQFEPYTKEQIFDILKDRAELGFRRNLISDDLIKRIAEMVNLEGDIRYGLNLLWKACKIAENRGLRIINVECIRLAENDSLSSYQRL